MFPKSAPLARNTHNTNVCRRQASQPNHSHTGQENSSFVVNSDNSCSEIGSNNDENVPEPPRKPTTEAIESSPVPENSADNSRGPSQGPTTSHDLFPLTETPVPSESFAIPTTESPTSVYSPINSYYFHHEPVETVVQPLGIRATLNGGGFFPVTLQERAELRLSRWRPSDSHHNTEDLVNGRHPYQNSSPDEKQATLIQRIFGKKKESPTITHRTLNNECKFCTDTSTENILSTVPLRNTSSCSLVQQAHISEPYHSTGPSFVYTPRAVPLEPVELNFTRGRPTSPLDYVDEMMDILNQVDNFCTHCFGSLSGIFSNDS